MSDPASKTSDLFRSFSEAFGRGDAVSATQRFLDAIDVDPAGAFRYFIFQASGNLNAAINQGGRRKEVVERLDSLIVDHPIVHYLGHPDKPANLERAVAVRQRNLDAGIPSVLFVPQGKSASVAVAQIFHAGFRLPSVAYSLVNADVIDSWAVDYARGGACYGTHLVPSLEKVAKLKAAGIDKIIVHVRDPRQALISLIHHFDAYPDQMPRLRAKSAGSTITERANNVLSAYRNSINWISGWVDAEEHISILFSTHEQFVRDKSAFVERYLEFYGAERRHFSFERAFRPSGGDYHFRKGRTDEWREVLEPEFAAKLSAMLPDRLKTKFGWPD